MALEIFEENLSGPTALTVSGYLAAGILALHDAFESARLSDRVLEAFGASDAPVVRLLAVC